MEFQKLLEGDLLQVVSVSPVDSKCHKTFGCSSKRNPEPEVWVKE